MMFLSERNFMKYLSVENNQRLCVRHTKNNSLLGEMVRGDDGIYTFWPVNAYGAWPDYILVEILDMLQELNANESSSGD